MRVVSATRAPTFMFRTDDSRLTSAASASVRALSSGASRHDKSDFGAAASVPPQPQVSVSST